MRFFDSSIFRAAHVYIIVSPRISTNSHVYFSIGSFVTLRRGFCHHVRSMTSLSESSLSVSSSPSSSQSGAGWSSEAGRTRLGGGGFTPPPSRGAGALPAALLLAGTLPAGLPEAWAPALPPTGLPPAPRPKRPLARLSMRWLCRGPVALPPSSAAASPRFDEPRCMTCSSSEPPPATR